MSVNQAGADYLEDGKADGFLLAGLCLVAGLVSWTIGPLLIFGASAALAAVFGLSDHVFAISDFLRANVGAVASIVGLLSVGTAITMVFVANGTR